MKALDDFINVYTQLGKNNLSTLGEVYSVDIYFCDPAHQLSGLEALMTYFDALYENVEEVTFTFSNQIEEGFQAALTWEMSVRHPRLHKGQNFSVEGISLLRFNSEGLVCYHRDYFDLGALLYERIPLLGSVITKIKERLAS